ncbi:MAG: hypothetical protein NZ951_02395 [Dehalococcoidia bacterium]|nr:hypothetical protein [Dehalococcoidia bacterium]MDW8119810.1 hypothetical protein [Chloroflexota bacterium]
MKGWVVLVFLVGMVCLWPWVLRAQEGGVVEGRIINGTAGGTVPPDLPVTLEVVRQRTLVDMRTATAGADGAFRFEGVPQGRDLAYLVSTSYQGVVYSAVAQGAQAWEQPIPLPIYEKTSGVEGVRVPSMTLVATGADARRRVLEFLHAVQVENSTDRTAVPDMQRLPRGVLRFGLPAEAQNLDVAATLPPGGEVVQGEQGFALTSAVPPGRYEVLYTYRVVYRGDALDFTLPVPLGAGVVRLMLPEDLAQVESPHLQGLEPATVGGRVYRLLEARGVPAGEVVSFRLVGLPQPPWFLAVVDTVSRPPWVVVVPGGVLGAVLLGVLVWAVRRSPQSPAGEG